MSLQLAAAMLQRLGPCRIALNKAEVPDLAQELALTGCDLIDVPPPGAHRRGAGKTAGFLIWDEADTGTAFAKALKPFAAMDALVLQSAGQPRHGIEQALFDAGWQRHAGGMLAWEYGSWTQYALPAITYYQRAPKKMQSALQSGTIESDALIARYAMASNHVRPGDYVLIDGKGSAEGKAILGALSRAGSIVRSDDKRDGIDMSLGTVADNSLDLIIAFEPAMPCDYASRLADYARVLKFDGRLVLGLRCAPGDNKGLADWNTLLEAVSEFFLPEVRYLHGPASFDPGGPQALCQASLEQEADGDWLILTASANPLVGEGRGEDYDHPAFPKAQGPWPALVDFAKAYDNPYLYRSMVQMGERLGHDLKLARLAECVIEDSRPDSADRGAAIAVLGYRILELRLADLAPSILPFVDAYLELPLDDETPAHVRRWRLSLAFLAGRLNELTGDRNAAKRWYRIAAQAEWAGFSPLLTTKSIAASFYEARLCLAEGDTETAKARFRLGFDTALKAVAFPHAEQAGPADRPLSFYMQELAEVIDMGSQCANALANFHLWERDPGLFWRQVDMRRFGLASWARDLERENERLRAL